MSQLRFYCVFCGSGINADARSASNVCECPKCCRFTPVPVAPGGPSVPWATAYPPGILSVEIKFACPECGSRLGMEAHNAGDTVLCPVCYERIQCPNVSLRPVPAQEGVVAASREDAGRTIIRLSREEIDFLSPEESPPRRTARHAS